MRLAAGEVTGRKLAAGGRPDCHWMADFKKRHYDRRALRYMPKPLSDEKWGQAINDYAEWAEMEFSAQD